jgi:hypothetical protein
MPTSPPFDAAYATVPTPPRKADVDPVSTIRPCSERVKTPAAAWARRTASLLTRLVRQRWHTARPRWSVLELRSARLGDEGGLRGAALLAAGIADDI